MENNFRNGVLRRQMSKSTIVVPDIFAPVLTISLELLFDDRKFELLSNRKYCCN